MAATPAFAALSRDEQTVMAQGLMNVAAITPEQKQTQQPNISSSVVQAEPIDKVADPIRLPPQIATLHEQITQHFSQGQFGNQLAHMSDKDQQTAIALATHEATRNNARSVDYVFVNKQGNVLMAFDGDRGFSSEMNLKQVPNNDVNQVLTASVDLQQTQQQDLAMRQSQSQTGPTIH